MSFLKSSIRPPPFQELTLTEQITYVCPQIAQNVRDVTTTFAVNV